jgi:predicted RNA-binding protein with PIN domain
LQYADNVDTILVSSSVQQFLRGEITVQRMGNVLLVANTRLHSIVQKLLFETNYSTFINQEDIREAEYYAQRAAGELREEVNERIGRSVRVWFEVYPPSQDNTWRVSMCVSDEMMQYAVFGDPGVLRSMTESVVKQMVDHMVSKMCAKVRDITAERDGNEEAATD